MTPVERKLLSALLQIPPDFNAASALLKKSALTPDQVSAVGYAYAEECCNESVDLNSNEEYRYSYADPILLPGLPSTYLYDVMKLLLEHGLNPNYADDHGNSILQAVIYTVNGYVAADTLNLLLDHGGNPNWQDDYDEPLFDSIDFGVTFDMIEQFDRRRFDSLVHCWFVLIGHGGRPSNGATPLDLFYEYGDIGQNVLFDVSKLKDHRNYTFGITHIENHGNSPTLHIFDKRTYWEVARI